MELLFGFFHAVLAEVPAHHGAVKRDEGAFLSQIEKKQGDIARAYQDFRIFADDVWFQ